MQIGSRIFIIEMVADESDRPMAAPRVQLGDYCERVERTLRSCSEGNSLVVGSPKSSFSGPPGWGLGIGPTTLSRKMILSSESQTKGSRTDSKKTTQARKRLWQGSSTFSVRGPIYIFHMTPWAAVIVDYIIIMDILNIHHREIAYFIIKCIKFF